MASNTFNQANGTALSAVDVKWTGDVSLLEVQSSTLQVTNTSLFNDRYVAYSNSQPNTQESEVVLKAGCTFALGQILEVTVQFQSSSILYSARISTTDLVLRKNGVFQSSSAHGLNLALAGNSIKITCNVSTGVVNAYANGALITTFTDGSPLTGGLPGFFINVQGNTAGDIGLVSWTDNISGSTTYTMSVSGGITYSGTAVQSRTRISQVSGGVVYGGVAPFSRTNIIPVSGGISYSGAAAIQRIRRSQVSGGITLSGVAAYLRTKIQQVSGGILFSGAGGYNKTRVEQVSGGVVYGGTGSMVYTPAAGGTTYTITPTGGFTLSGVGGYQRTRIEQISGGILLSGAAVISRSKRINSGGTILYGGHGPMVFVPAGGGGGGNGDRNCLAINWNNTLGI